MTSLNTPSSQDRIAGLLAYVFFLIPMIMGKKTDFTMFHAKQSLMLLFIGILGMFVPFFGGLISFSVFVVSIWCMYQSYLGNKSVIPFL